MAIFTILANQIYRDFNTDGVPASGKKKPVKAEVRTWGTEAETEHQIARNMLGSKNVIINGPFAFWQRNTTFNVVGPTADLWRMDFVSGTVVFSRQDITVGELLGVHNPAYSGRISVSGQAAAGDFASVSQRINSVRNFAGQTITVLFWAKRTAGAGNLAVELIQNFGLGGSPSADVLVAPVSVAIGSTWVAYAAVFNVPSISGKTIGTLQGGYLEVRIWASAGSNFNARTGSLGIQTIDIDLWGLHTGAGSQSAAHSTLYVQPKFTNELFEVERYFSKSYDLLTSQGSITNNGAIMNSPDATNSFANLGTVTFTQLMKGVPALTFYNPVTGLTTNPIRNYDDGTDHPITVNQVSQRSFNAKVNNSSIAAGKLLGVHYTADADT